MVGCRKIVVDPSDLHHLHPQGPPLDPSHIVKFLKRYTQFPGSMVDVLSMVPNFPYATAPRTSGSTGSEGSWGQFHLALKGTFSTQGYSQTVYEGKIRRGYVREWSRNPQGCCVGNVTDCVRKCMRYVTDTPVVPPVDLPHTTSPTLPTHISDLKRSPVVPRIYM